MLKLYNRTDSITFPNGVTYSSDQLKTMDSYKMLFFSNCILDIVDGITYSFQPMANYINQYEIDEEDDPEKTFKKIMDKITEEKINRDKMKDLKRSLPSIDKISRFMAVSLTDEQAVEVPDLYPEFELNHEYKQNDRFQYNNSLYKVNQAHTSQAQWVPGDEGTEALYTNLMLDDSGHQIWKQPTGAHDAYNTGDIVNYNGKLYISTIDGNAWAPDTYPAGWQEYDESTSTEPGTPEPGTPDPGTETYPDFVQPTGAHDAYKKGDIVRYNGKLYQSLIDANAYSPDAYPQGWQEYSEE